MRLLAPTRRTPNAKGGESKPTPNGELAELRRLSAEYAMEANNEIKRLNEAKLAREKYLEEYQKEQVDLLAKKEARERELSIEISALEAKVVTLNASADATRLKKRISELDQSIKETEQERESLRTSIEDVEKSRLSVQNLSEELDEREEQLNSGFDQLTSAKKEVETKREQVEKEIALKLSELSLKEGQYKAREDAIFNKEHGIIAIERSLELLKSALDTRAEEISKQERLLVDRRAKLESLIAYYERKTR